MSKILFSYYVVKTEMRTLPCYIFGNASSWCTIVSIRLVFGVLSIHTMVNMESDLQWLSVSSSHVGIRR
jgi:hypothetical protein